MIYFCLSGGNTKGSYQAGAIKGLEDKGIHADAVFGTSTGAVNSLGYAYSTNAQQLIDMWLGLKTKRDIVSAEWWKLGFMKGFFNLNPLRSLLTSYCQGKQPRCEATVSYVDLVSSDLIFSSNRALMPRFSMSNTKRMFAASKMAPTVDSFIDDVISSASQPPAVVPNNGHVDGGVRRQTPLVDLLKQLGPSDTVYLILTSNDAEQEGDPFDPGSAGFLQTFARSIDIAEHELLYTDVNDALISKMGGEIKVIQPAFGPSLLGTFEVNTAKFQQIIQMGYDDAVKVAG